jgi:hypothetical protein
VISLYAQITRIRGEQGKERIGIGILRRGPGSIEEKCIGTWRTGRRSGESE